MNYDVSIATKAKKGVAGNMVIKSRIGRSDYFPFKTGKNQQNLLGKLRKLP